MKNDKKTFAFILAMHIKSTFYKYESALLYYSFKNCNLFPLKFLEFSD